MDTIRYRPGLHALYRFTIRSVPLGLLGLLTALYIGLPLDVYASAAGARNATTRMVGTLERHGYTFVDNGSGLLARGEVKVLEMHLTAGQTYAIVTGGCEDAYDVDLAVLDENRNLIGKDTDQSSVAVVHVTPRWSGKFFAAVQMYRSTPDGAHYVLLLGRQGRAAPAPTVARYNVRIENHSRFAVHRLYMSSTRTDQWGADHLGRGVLASGHFLNLQTHRGAYDLKLVDEDGDVCILRNINVSEHTTWTITDRALLQCEGYNPGRGQGRQQVRDNLRY